jgi:hypothetical protein
MDNQNMELNSKNVERAGDMSAVRLILDLGGQ